MGSLVALAFVAEANAEQLASLGGYGGYVVAIVAAIIYAYRSVRTVKREEDAADSVAQTAKRRSDATFLKEQQMALVKDVQEMLTAERHSHAEAILAAEKKLEAALAGIDRRHDEERRRWRKEVEELRQQMSEARREAQAAREERESCERRFARLEERLRLLEGETDDGPKAEGAGG